VTGHSHTINRQPGLIHLHRLRALVDAVVVGVGTVLADDPRLTVRLASGPQPARVVIDPRGRLPADARCLTDDGSRRIVVQETAIARAPGIETITIATTEGRMAPAAIVAALQDAGLQRILIEGGAATLSEFLTASCLDHLHLILGAMIIGSGTNGLTLPAIARLDQAWRPSVEAYPLGDGDILLDCAFRRTE